MKVGVYFPGFSKDSGGGYTFEWEMIQSLSRLASESRHELVVFFGKTEDFDIPTELTNAGLKMRVIEEPRKRLKIIRKVYQRLQKELGMPITPDPPSALQLAAQQEKIEFIWFATSIFVPVDIPYIATVWDIQHRLQPWFPEVSRNGQWEYREAYYSAYLKRAAYIITPNRAGQDELALFYQLPPERFRLLSHPTPNIERVPTEDEVERVLEKYQLSRGYLFYPAQFWAHKNHVNLLLALRELKETFGQERHLVLVGSDQGNLENVRWRTQRLGLEEQVHFLDFIPREDIIALYCGAFALTYVSLFGPENLPPLEAFKCGCPVISAKVRGAQEQYGEAALVVDGLVPEEIALAVIRLEQEAGLRQSLIKNGQQRADAYKGVDYVRDVIKIFDEFENIRRNWGTS